MTQQDGSTASRTRTSSVSWNDTQMATAFANVVNVQGTREQIELFFGTSRGLKPEDDTALQVDLSNRLILTPHAAKRLNTILKRVLDEYESRHGRLETGE